MIFAGDTSNSVTVHAGSWMWYRRGALSSRTMRINENKRRPRWEGMFAFSCRCQRQEIREITAGSPPPPVSNHLLSQTVCTTDNQFAERKKSFDCYARGSVLATMFVYTLIYCHRMDNQLRNGCFIIAGLETRDATKWFQVIGETVELRT